MANTMISLCYVSHIEEPLSNDEINHLLRGFRENNARLDVSGLLLYNGANTFIQILEGETNTVSTLYNTISADTRHSQVDCLLRSDIIDRDFADWKMGFRNLSTIALIGVEGFSEFMQSKNAEDYLHKNPQFVDAIVQHFKKQSRSMATNKQTHVQDSKHVI
jgi:hypothetical protein